MLVDVSPDGIDPTTEPPLTASQERPETVNTLPDIDATGVYEYELPETKIVDGYDDVIESVSTMVKFIRIVGDCDGPTDVNPYT